MATGRAKLAMGQGVSVWVLEAPDGFGDAQPHSHHAIQLAFCLRGALALASDAERVSAPAIAVAADARHRLEAHGLLAIVFVEPESRAGRALEALLFSRALLVALDGKGLSEAVAPLATTFEDELGVEELLRISRAVVEGMVPAQAAPVPDPRVQRIIDYASSHLDRPLTLTSASEGIYLSPSRLRHLFVEQTGLAFRTYLLWLRLVRAVQIYSQGTSLTEAAHAAGFADSAHFSRVFKRTFGSPATTLERL